MTGSYGLAALAGRDRGYTGTVAGLLAAEAGIEAELEAADEDIEADNTEPEELLLVALGQVAPLRRDSELMPKSQEFLVV